MLSKYYHKIITIKTRMLNISHHFRNQTWITRTHFMVTLLSGRYHVFEGDIYLSLRNIWWDWVHAPYIVSVKYSMWRLLNKNITLKECETCKVSETFGLDSLSSVKQSLMNIFNTLPTVVSNIRCSTVSVLKIQSWLTV